MFKVLESKRYPNGTTLLIEPDGRHFGTICEWPDGQYRYCFAGEMGLKPTMKAIRTKLRAMGFDAQRTFF